MSATIRDVARHAGVSVGSVSRYLNGYRLKEENMVRIRAAVEALDFKENMLAKGLKNSRSRTVGVLISSVTDLFTNAIVAAAEETLRQANYSMLLCTYTGGPGVLAQKAAFLKERMVDGMLVFPYTSEEGLAVIRELVDEGMPLVTLDAAFPETGADAVVSDNREASAALVRHLLDTGHRRIAVISGDPMYQTAGLRLAGYLDALEEKGLVPGPSDIQQGHFSSAGGQTAMLRLLAENNPPDAVFITNFYMTLGAMQVVNRQGIHVPEVLSVVAFDRFEPMDIFYPMITVAEQDTAGMGQQAAALLIQRMRGNEDLPHRVVSVPAKVQFRDSVAPRR